jgi:AAA domain
MCAPRTWLTSPPTRRAPSPTSPFRPYLVQPLQAPAGAGKTHSLHPLRAAVLRANKDLLVIAPTGRAVDEAMRGGAGDRGLTVAKALRLIEDDQLQVDRCTVIVVDEASMVGTAELRRLIEASTAARSSLVTPISSRRSKRVLALTASAVHRRPSRMCH